MSLQTAACIRTEVGLTDAVLIRNGEYLGNEPIDPESKKKKDKAKEWILPVLIRSTFDTNLREW